MYSRGFTKFGTKIEVVLSLHALCPVGCLSLAWSLKNPESPNVQLEYNYYSVERFREIFDSMINSIISASYDHLTLQIFKIEAALEYAVSDWHHLICTDCIYTINKSHVLERLHDVI